MTKHTILFLLAILMCLSMQAQTKEQIDEAENYYQIEGRGAEISKRLMKFWTKMFSEDYIDFSEPELVEWEYNNGWYLGKNGRGLRDGIGTYYFSKSDTRYFGGWKRDNQHGLGVNMAKASLYIGFWDDDKQDGWGIKHWPPDAPLESGDYTGVVKYFGEYKANKWHGYGIVYLNDGTYKSGIWIQNVLSKELPKLEVFEKLGF